ncbi:hypothetical protein GCM10027262_24480 [Nocardia tengchongensis]
MSGGAAPGAGVGVFPVVVVTADGVVIAASEAVPMPVIWKTEAVIRGMFRSVTENVRPLPGRSSTRAIRALAAAPGAWVGAVDRTVPVGTSRSAAQGIRRSIDRGT